MLTEFDFCKNGSPLEFNFYQNPIKWCCCKLPYTEGRKKRHNPFQMQRFLYYGSFHISVGRNSILKHSTTVRQRSMCLKKLMELAPQSGRNFMLYLPPSVPHLFIIFETSIYLSHSTHLVCCICLFSAHMVLDGPF